MVESKKVINYFRENLDAKDYVSFFVAGSLPKKLIHNTDLDLFFVIKNSRKNTFFDKLVLLAKSLCTENPILTYSFFRGPLKVEDKALLHFIVYTEDFDEGALTKREQFSSEDQLFLKSFLESSKIISGKSIKEMLSGGSFAKSEESYNIKRKRDHLKTLRERGYIEYFEWQKNGDEWRYLPSKKIPDEKFKKYLVGYYKKSLLKQK